MKPLEKIVLTANWQDKAFYSKYMKQTYGFTSRSVELLNYIANNLDHVPLLQKRFQEHSQEENGHESLAIKDIRNLGIDPDSIQVNEETKNFIEAQFKMAIECPESVLGWIIMLETLPITVGREITEKVSKKFGENAAIFLKLHCEEDEDHIQSAWDALELLPKESINQIKINFDISYDLYIKMLNSCN